MRISICLPARSEEIEGRNDMTITPQPLFLMCVDTNKRSSFIRQLNACITVTPKSISYKSILVSKTLFPIQTINDMFTIKRRVFIFCDQFDCCLCVFKERTKPGVFLSDNFNKQ